MANASLSGPGVRLMDAGDIATALIDSKQTLNQTTGTIPAGVITGGATVTVYQTNSTPGTQTTRTAAQMFADDPTATIPGGYTLIICNSGAGTLTLAGGTGVTVTGTATVATNTARMFNVTYSGNPQAVAVTITNAGTWTYT